MINTTIPNVINQNKGTVKNKTGKKLINNTLNKSSIEMESEESLLDNLVSDGPVNISQIDQEDKTDEDSEAKNTKLKNLTILNMTNSDNEENQINIIDSQLGNITINKEDIMIEDEDSTKNNLKPVNKSIIKPKSVKNMSNSSKIKDAKVKMSNTSKIKDAKVKMSNTSKINDTQDKDSKKGNLTD